MALHRSRICMLKMLIQSLLRMRASEQLVTGTLAEGPTVWREPEHIARVDQADTSIRGTVDQA